MTERQDQDDASMVSTNEMPHAPMLVRDVIEALADVDPNGVMVICAHGFPGMENSGWLVSHLETVTVDGSEIVLIEGAGFGEAEEQQAEQGADTGYAEAERHLGRGEV